MASMIESCNPAPQGVSIIVPTYNGAKRLPQTLAHIINQRVDQSIEWEVIVIDNASVDSTAEVASGGWPKNMSVPFRVIHEPKQGKSYAIIRGFNEAKFEYISMVDDDNWIDPTWVQNTYNLFNTNPQIGVAGSLNAENCEISPPPWFKNHCGIYAVGPQGDTGDITWVRGTVYGAGMCIRRSAWQQIARAGYEPELPCRKGERLSLSGDTELSLAIRSAGWKIWYDQNLRLSHRIPAKRLNWKYVRKNFYELGLAGPYLDPYHWNPSSFYKAIPRLRGTWQWQIISLIKKFIFNLPKLLKWTFYDKEGDWDVLWVDSAIARFCELIQKRDYYNQYVRRIMSAAWRKY